MYSLCSYELNDPLFKWDQPNPRSTFDTCPQMHYDNRDNEFYHSFSNGYCFEIFILSKLYMFKLYLFFKCTNAWKRYMRKKFFILLILFWRKDEKTHTHNENMLPQR